MPERGQLRGVISTHRNRSLRSFVHLRKGEIRKATGPVNVDKGWAGASQTAQGACNSAIQGAGGIKLTRGCRVLLWYLIYEVGLGVVDFENQSVK